MNDMLTRKKHSKRIAKLALQKGFIDKDFYNELYIEAYDMQRTPKRKNKYGYRFGRYYEELYFCTCDYWGECDETSIIHYVSEMIFWTFCEISTQGDILSSPKYTNSTLSIIKFLSSLKKGEWQEIQKRLDDNINSML